ncbi:MAG: hypothetical protein GXO86_11725 [Chlorobi bacterium]|nr:hypothetical protein [Chlorobiota bacterium]
MKISHFFIALLSLLITGMTLNAQSGSLNGFSEDETVLYTMNKQVGQFIKRFNMEEDQFGKTLPVNDKRYRNNNARQAATGNV